MKRRSRGKKVVLVALALVCLHTVSFVGKVVEEGNVLEVKASQAEVGRWERIGGKWYYKTYRGVHIKGWFKDKGTWYYTNNKGIMQTGWTRVGNTWYYMNSSGAMQTGWVKVNNEWYYMNSSGAMQTGWVKVNNVWYYMNSSGAMQTGWVKANNEWYYMNENGSMRTGWLEEGRHKYYLKTNGSMQTGWISEGTTHYKFDSGGRLQHEVKRDLYNIDIRRFNESFLKYVNQERVKVGVRPLKYNKELQRGVNKRLDELVGENKISHVRPDGTSYRTAFDYMGGSYNSLGENVASNWYTGEYKEVVSQKVRTTEDLVAEVFYLQYKDSKPHYDNMMNGKYTSMAVSSGIVEDQGEYYEKMFSVMVFVEDK